MATKKTTNGALDASRLVAMLEEVNERLRAMEERIHHLEARVVEPKPVAAAPAPPPIPVAAAKPVDEKPVEETIDPEIMMVISAAVAAFMGVKARIRRVRRAAPGMNPWAQQGRVSIQASHNVVWAR